MHSMHETNSRQKIFRETQTTYCEVEIRDLHSQQQLYDVKKKGKILQLL